MDTIMDTPRLKLVLVTKAERGSAVLQQFHEMFSNKDSTWWSIYGQSKAIEDTEKRLSYILPSGTTATQQKSYRVVYAVYKLLDGPTSNHSDLGDQNDRPIEFIGAINLKSLDPGSLPIPEQFTLPASAASTTLTVEIAYMFLPSGWGKGYATEAIAAMYEACQRAPEVWSPYKKLYVRSIVNSTNLASLRVMDKVGMKHNGVYEWSGEAIFLAGEWRDHDRLVIRGRYLLE